MPNKKNTDTVQILKDKIAKSKSITFVDYMGLDSNNVNELRQQIRDVDGEMSVAKNTLLKVALKESNLESEALNEDLNGPTSVVFSYSDPVETIKKLVEFAKNFELPKIKAAIFEGNYTSSDQVLEISKLPSKEELIARVVGGFKSPLNNIVGVMGGVQRNFVYAINAIADKKSQEA